MSQIPRLVVFGLLICLLSIHGIAIQSKALRMHANGIEASNLLNQILPCTSIVPSGRRLILLNPRYDSPEYSVIDMNGINVLSYGTNIINQLPGRDDNVIRIFARLEDLRESLPDSS